jgi:serine/threonine-protein kinase HSL1, negative regulator of Swe1 kinase
MRHKRGVEFNHSRKRSQSAKAGPRKTSQATVEVIQMGDTNQKGSHDRSVSPELPVRADGKYPMAKGVAKGAPTPKIKTKEPEEAFTEEELRHFSSNIAKDCDNAFRSSLIEEESIAGSLGESERKHRGSPFTFSMESTPIMTPATEMSMKTWDSRPLPPLPSDKALHSQIMTSPRLNSASAITLVDSEDADNITKGVARIVVPIRVGQPGDRRVMSAPAQTHSNRRLATMPSINEDTTLNVVNHDKSRIVSAPPHTPRKRLNGQAQGMEYLSRVENSIRVVQSPTAISPVKVPSPLRVQKKSAANQQQHSFSDEESHGNQRSQDGGVVMKKKKSWFKRTSRAESDGAVPALRDQYAAADQDNGEYHEGPHEAPGKKKSFSFPFWKTGKSSELKMSMAGKLSHRSDDASDVKSNTETDNESSEKPAAPKENTVTKVENRRHSNASSHRTIEVKQNWLARLFRVKPATSYLCMTISRRRARQEVAILLQEWMQYGIRGIQVDKQRNIIFARVGAKNCEYLAVRWWE